VDEIAAALPLSARLLEQLGIDYCCGGRTALRDACTTKGLDPVDVIHRIQNAAPPNTPAAATPAAATTPAATPPEATPPAATTPAATTPAATTIDWLSAPLDALIDHILATHHTYTKSQLPRLDAMLEKILSKHGGLHGEVLHPLAKTFRPMREELEGHLLKEETILFPLIRQLETSGAGGTGDSRFHCGSVRNPIRVMTMEHDSAGQALARMRELTAGYTALDDACNTFRAFYAELAELERDLHRHIHLENNILFPRAVELEAVGLAQ
jgi:regulator of cell morphogenesis and NO signaling